MSLLPKGQKTFLPFGVIYSLSLVRNQNVISSSSILHPENYIIKWIANLLHIFLLPVKLCAFLETDKPKMLIDFFSLSRPNGFIRTVIGNQYEGVRERNRPAVT